MTCCVIEDGNYFYGIATRAVVCSLFLDGQLDRPIFIKFGLEAADIA